MATLLLSAAETYGYHEISTRGAELEARMAAGETGEEQQGREAGKRRRRKRRLGLQKGTMQEYELELD